jgi:Phage integrase family
MPRWLQRRHEAASRFVEGGWLLQHVQEMLGHSNLKQTSTYVNAKQVDLAESPPTHCLFAFRLQPTGSLRLTLARPARLRSAGAAARHKHSHAPSRS